MKKLALLLAIIVAAEPAFAQNAPLTQAEYSKLVYALRQGKTTREDIIDALRKRGIDFVLTDGIRGFTRSNSANDEELRSALEEAGRRKQDPEAAKLPTEAEAQALLERSRAATAAALEEMPDFVVKQVISRSASYAGTGNWRPLDTLIVAVSYSSEKGEQYQVLALNGAPVQSQKQNSYANTEGSTTGGEFVEALSKLFSPESKTTFTVLTTDVLRGRPALVYDYEILLANNPKGGVGFKTPGVGGGYSFTTVPSGEKGRVWIDRGDGRILRIAFNATEIPRDFKVRAYQATIDYDWVNIAGERVLLPVTSDNRFTSADGQRLFQDRNYIRFRNYQKYGSEVRILDDDVTVEPAPIPEKPL